MSTNQILPLSEGIPRRDFIKAMSALGLSATMPSGALSNPTPVKLIRVRRTDSNFEREPLIRPFGFKGGYLTELWQTACQLEAESGTKRVGICTQNVLYADATVFERHSEAAGNALMYALTDYALQRVREMPFRTPIDLLDALLPVTYEEGQRLTRQAGLNKIFALNALIGIDNAAWLLYAAENGLGNFDAMIPAPYRPALSHRNKHIAIMYLASYRLPMDELRRAVAQGYFVIKIKIGQPGTQADMLDKDKARLSEVHQALREARTRQTPNGKLIYTLDANGRYEKKETLVQLLDHARSIGALDQILFIEEPLTETNEENVADVGVRIAADESAHDVEGARKRFEQGYQALVLKGIAKTLSMSMKKAQLAYERGIPCICADLTVNPILVDWHKNLAARLAPFPGLGMGIMETNGDLNYRNWTAMMSYNPSRLASWIPPKAGVFTLNADFYEQSGGIFRSSEHYEKFFSKH